MAPERSPKRVKTSPVSENSTLRKPEEIPLPATPGPIETVTQQDNKTKDESRRASWYNRTWPRKAAPITEVARESISSASNAAVEAIASVKKPSTKTKANRSPSLAMTLGKSKSNRSTPAQAATSTVHATPQALSPTKSRMSNLDAISTSKDATMAKIGSNGTDEEPSKSLNETKPESSAEDKVIAATTDNPDGSGRLSDPSQASWLTWLAKTGPAMTGKETAKEPNDTRSLREAPKPVPFIQGGEEAVTPEAAKLQSVEQAGDQPSNKRSWLQMWGPDTPTKSAPPSIKGGKDAKDPASSAPLPMNTSNLKAESTTPAPSQASSVEISAPPPLPGDGSKSAGWVFWSRERKNDSSMTSVDQPHVGEIAISNTTSASRPRRASMSVPKSRDNPEPGSSASKDVPKDISSKSDGKTGAKLPEKADAKSKSTSISKDSKARTEAVKVESSNAAATAKSPTEAQSLESTAKSLSKRSTDAQLLPSFKETFKPQASPSFLEQISRLFYYSKTPELKHLSIAKDIPRIKSALAIGVHGYFPAPLIRTVLGQPTGTSIKFADMAARSIRRWTSHRGYDCTVKTAALEGEGKIAERVELLWRLLLNWIDEIRKADFVLIACHSQGVPVAIMLVAKLIDFGCVSAARVGICAMAGVSMGPFVDYKSRWISGSAGELFEFSDSSSKVSRNYLAALETVLKFGVRVSFIGSIDDQLVSLESSIFSSITHPHIYRAVLIDGRTHAPNFLSHLVGFALKLRNLGVPDHGLIRELSSPLAGSLYTGEGHSRIYEDEAVYDLAVEFALETNEMRNVDIQQRPSTVGAGNPYILPFAMRGILEEDFVKTELQDEAQDLLKEFDDWRPTTKVLKDVKFRLEGIRSKL